MYQFTPLALKTITKTQNWYVWYVWYVPGPELFWPSMPSPRSFPPRTLRNRGLATHRSELIGVTKWPLELVCGAVFCARGVSPPRRCWGGFGGQVWPNNRPKTRKQDCLCCNFGRLCAQCPKALRRKRKRNGKRLMCCNFGRPYAQECPKAFIADLYAIMVDVLQRPRAAYAQMPERPNASDREG
jgi:hypothetical protein